MITDKREADFVLDINLMIAELKDFINDELTDLQNLIDSQEHRSGLEANDALYNKYELFRELIYKLDSVVPKTLISKAEELKKVKKRKRA